MKWFIFILSAQIRMKLAYPWGFWLSLSVELLVVAAINWFLWSSILGSSPNSALQGFTLTSLVLYSLTTSTVRKVQMGTDQFGGIGDDIYSGSLNKYLVYPIPYFGFRFAMHLGGALLSLVQSFAALMLFWLFFAKNQQALPQPLALAQFLVMTLFAITIGYLFNVWIQSLAFWFEQVWALLVMQTFLIMLLGGQLLPMSLYPPWAQHVLSFSPFPMLAAWPAEALLGRMSGEFFWRSCLVGTTWILLGYLGARLTFAKGVRNYSGIGA